MINIKKICLLVACLSFFSTQIFATPINVSFVRTLPSHTGSAYDASTGKYYQRYYYSPQIQVFDNKAQFEAGVSSATLTLQDGTFGTYFEVQDGKIYSRSNQYDSSISIWDATTGAKQLSSSIPTMGGTNGTHTFNWGGFSGVNFMEDQGNLYLMGKNASNVGWQVNEVDQNLNVLSTQQYNKGILGYAFIINNLLFSSDSYNSNAINSMLDLTTGMQQTVDFTLEGLGSLYMNNVNYVGATDTLYLHDLIGNELMKIDNAAAKFGAASVPEPGSFILVAFGLAWLTIYRRKGFSADIT